MIEKLFETCRRGLRFPKRVFLGAFAPLRRVVHGVISQRVVSPRLYFRWIRRWRSVPIRSWLIAARLFESGDFISAVPHYVRGLTHHPKHPAAGNARFDLAYSLYRLGRIRAALAELELLVRNQPENRDATLLYGRLLFILGRSECALREIYQATEIFLNDPAPHVALLHLIADSPDSIVQDVAWRTRAYRSRAKLLTQLDLMPAGSSPALAVEAALAAFDLRLGNREAGEQRVLRLLAGGSVGYEVLFMRGLQFLAADRVLQARELLTRATRLAPRDPRPVVYLAHSYLRAGAFESPLFALQLAQSAATSTEYSNPRVLDLLAEAHAAAGNCEEAELYRGLAYGIRIGDRSGEKKDEALGAAGLFDALSVVVQRDPGRVASSE